MYYIRFDYTNNVLKLKFTRIKKIMDVKSGSYNNNK